MTQHELILTYIQEHSSILPAKLYGSVYRGVMFGSETSKRCRELRAHTLPSVQRYPRLDSDGEGKFERFWLCTETPRAKILATDILRRFATIPAKKAESIKISSLGI
jgi:hypothetical protein